MEKDIKINYQRLKLLDLGENVLANFNRYQQTTRAWYPIQQPITKYPENAKLDDCYYIKKTSFVDEWDNLKKSNVIQSLKNCIISGGFVIGGYQANQLIAFASVENQIFGSCNQYAELTYLHVSHELRGQGIGKSIFQFCCEKGRKKEIKKLYISTHPSIESQCFYKAIGCVLAQEINHRIYLREPLDVQMEYTL